MRLLSMTWLCAIHLLHAPAPPGEAEADPRTDTPRADAPEEVDDEERVIVVSTGTRTDRDAATAPVATTVVTREDIVESGAETVAEVLEQAGAGIQTSEGLGGTELSLRGFDSEQVLILVDGQRVTGRIDGAIDLSRFTVEDVERIEIVQGAGSVVQGSDAIGGLVNIITRRPEPGVDTEIHGAYGSRNTVDASGRIAGGMRRWQLSGSGGYHRTDGWDADTSNLATTGDAAQLWNLGVGAHLQPVPGLRLDLSGRYLRRDSQGIDQTEGGATLDRRNLTETLDATLAATWVDADSRLRVSLHTNGFHDQFRQDQRDADALDKYEPTRDQVAQASVQYDQMVGKHVVTTGLDVQFEWLETVRIAPTGSNQAERQRVALFVQDEWTPSTAPRISLLPSLRVDYDSQFGAYPTGRLALLAAPRDDLTVRVAYGRGYRAPSFRELYLSFANPGVGYRVLGNPQLQPEQAWTLDLGLTWTPSEALTLAVGLFDNQLRDLMTLDLVSEAGVDALDLYTYINVGSASVRGVEGSAAVEFLRWFEIEGSYMFLHARDVQSGLPLPSRAAHQGTFGLRFHQPRWGTRAVVRGNVRGRRAFEVGEDTTQYADPYATIDLRISQHFLRYLTGFIGIENLLDAGDAVVTPIAPRSYYGGLTFRY